MRQSTPSFGRRIKGFCSSICLLILLLAVETSSFTVYERINARSPASPLAVAAAPEEVDTDTSTTVHFHKDMKRVLENKAQRLHNKLERRQKPLVLQDDTDGVQRVLTMLDRMVELNLATEETFQIALRACLGRGRLRWHPTGGGNQIICAADQCGSLLEQWKSISEDRISLETYNMVLEAYATCSTPRGGRKYAQRAQDLLETMEQEGVFGSGRVEDLDHEPTIPVETLTHVLHAWAWQQANKERGDCAERAHEYLEQIEPQVDPTVLLQCYDWVLEAWSKSGSPGAAQKADEVFSKFKALNQTVGSTILNTQSYSNAILAWSKNQDPGSAQKAHTLLLELLDRYQKGCFSVGEEPELIAFNGVITAWAKRGNPTKAAQVLWKMESIQSNCKELVPDVVTYNTVLHAHVMSPNKTQALKEIIQIVDFMEEHCVEQPAICPTSFTYNTLMKAWIRSGEADLAQQAERILSKMEQRWQQGDDKVEPTNRHFNVVINAYAKSSDPFAARKAYDLLQRMKGGSFRSKPDIISYTSVIECFSKSADPKAAEIVTKLLEEAFRVHKETGVPAMRPNLRTFTMVILTLANCNNGSIVEARDLLTRLVALYEETKDEALMPNAYPYNYVLNCAANTMQDKMQAFRLATQTYQEMRESQYVSPDSYTYAFWFKCCNNLLRENKDLKFKCMFYAFDECRKEGLVSNAVLNRLQRAVSANLLEEWLGIPKRKDGFRDLKVSELPPDWSRNAQR